MVSKLDFYTAVYEDILPQLTEDIGQWQDFLLSASKNYKLRFDEQVLVFAQKPEASAVLELERWNSAYNRWVNKGAHGIAVFSYDIPGKTRLKYYFDISDTHGGRYARPVSLWEMKPDYEGEVTENLADTFSEIDSTGTLTDALLMAAEFSVSDNIEAYTEQLLPNRAGTGLEDILPDEAADKFFALVRASVSYTLLSRCGYDAGSIVPASEFIDLPLFGSTEAAEILGTATNDIAEQTLREIASTVRSCMREGKNEIRTFAEPDHVDDNIHKEETAVTETERSESNDRDEPDLQGNAGRLYDPGRESSGGTESEPRPLGEDETEPPEGERQANVRTTTDARQDDESPRTDRDGSRRADPADYGTVSGADGRKRDAQSREPETVDGADEQHPSDSGADRDQRADTRVEEDEPDEDPPEAELEWSHKDEKAEGESLPFLDGEKMDAILTEAPDIRKHHDAIATFFEVYDSADSRRAFVRSKFTGAFTGVFIGESRDTYGYRAYMDALHLWSGHYLTRTEEIYLSWDEAAERFAALTELGRIQSVPLEQLLKLPEVESKQLSFFDLPEDSAEAVGAGGSSFETAAEPSEPEPKPVTENSALEETEKRNFRITDDDLGHGGAKAKYRFNIGAIKTLNTIESENRSATPEEQEILSRYVGWGGIPGVFDEQNSEWHSEYLELKELLDAAEYDSARATTLNAHYTSPVVIKAMYKAIENMGFQSGNILEPSCGIGNFMGLVSDSMSKSKFYGVELDPITGRIAQQLYQKNNIRIGGFESAPFGDNFFDVAIGNVPFGAYGVADRKFDKHHFMIHDYFFAKTLDKVRPGGIVAFITSKGTLDKKNPAVRKYIAQRAELIGAIRLPNNAFLANAGTAVTSDIIFLQKRDRMMDIEPDWVHLGETKDGIPVNSYFAENPDMILGEMSREATMHYGRGDETTCKPFEDADLSELLEGALANIHAEITEHEIDEPDIEDVGSIPADPEVRNFSFTILDGKIYFRENSIMYRPDTTLTAQERIRGMIEIRDCLRNLITYQSEGYPDELIDREQVQLNKLYDSYTKKYGLLNSRGNSLAFEKDSSYYLLCSLENLDENKNLISKAAMFTKRTIRPITRVESVDTPSEALAVSVAEKAGVDMEYMSTLCGKSEQEIYEDLRGVIFYDTLEDPPVYRTADEFLSGNVRQKLRAWNRTLEALSAQLKTVRDTSGDQDTISETENAKLNISALERVQPDDLTASEIEVRLGATWLPPEMAEQFMFELLDTPHYVQDRITVRFSPFTANWNIEGKNSDYGNVKANGTYGTRRINAYKIIEETLNLKDVRIFDYEEDADGKRTAVLNKKETMIAQQKQEAVKSAFDDWVWKDQERRAELVRIYNEKFNSIRPREYDGSHITFGGINPEIELFDHQKTAVARILYGGNTLLAHVVGAGKTFEMTAAAMESKRLGLANKSMFVVPNHLTEQWASEFLQLYPAANILVATKKDFETKNRKKFCSRIATGEYDAVIIGHSQFEKIPLSAERQRMELEKQIYDITQGVNELKAERGERYTIKELEKMKKSLELKLTKLNDQSRKDDVVTFEEIGVDRIFIDEAHYYKNLYVYTKMRNVGGIAQTEAQKSSDLFMKCRYLDEVTENRGTIFATGTPISNSMVEMYTMQRYLQYDMLDRHDLKHFDAWASTFGEQTTAIELSPEGTGYRAKTRFSKFYNLPELMSMFREVADIKTSDMLNLPVPKANYHNVVIKPSDMQKELVASLSERADKVRKKQVDATVDNMLVITNDGRKIALDERLVNPLLPNRDDGKVSVCVDNVRRIWEETKKERLTQLVFCDLSTPKGDGGFNVYDDIKEKLIGKDVPEEEIAFIHSANTETQKKELFAKARSGQIRILLGSTQKMGAGTNIQDRLIALHDLDCPWRPSDLEQRSGRIVRQGNRNPEVDIYRYVTEGTFDSYLYQLVENKQRFISQIMTSKSPVRSAEDVDEASLSYAEIKALASGNPHIKEKMDLDIKAAKLKIVRGNFFDHKYMLEDKLAKGFPEQIAKQEELIVGYTNDISTLCAFSAPDKESFSPMTIGGVTHTERKDAGDALIQVMSETGTAPVVIGQYCGFEMRLHFDAFDKAYVLTLVGDLRHKVTLGTDPRGNLTRIDNVLSGFSEKLKECEERLSTTKQQIATAKEEVARPFPQEEEMKQTEKRLRELNTMLNLDEKSHDAADIDMEPDENTPADAPAKDEPERER